MESTVETPTTRTRTATSTRDAFLQITQHELSARSESTTETVWSTSTKPVQPSTTTIPSAERDMIEIIVESTTETVWSTTTTATASAKREINEIDIESTSESTRSTPKTIVQSMVESVHQLEQHAVLDAPSTERTESVVWTSSTVESTTRGSDSSDIQSANEKAAQGAIESEHENLIGQKGQALSEITTSTPDSNTTTMLSLYQQGVVKYKNYYSLCCILIFNYYYSLPTTV